MVKINLKDPKYTYGSHKYHIPSLENCQCIYSKFIFSLFPQVLVLLSLVLGFLKHLVILANLFFFVFKNPYFPLCLTYHTIFPVNVEMIMHSFENVCW